MSYMFIVFEVLGFVSVLLQNFFKSMKPITMIQSIYIGRLVTLLHC